ncbi:cytochrome C biogenesis protein [Parasulfuritortus cantonensis]|uniref:Cytochrome C biogenesis protein n=1 Tax=Parasulfuritortus cantonensis TaxID=2528202 RepID=A0A4R1BGW3_9PROT|nr:cytochrome c biogenesis protein CcsA [Parasulfuritortus cantonensis]TCJ16328.1 cytochrome C biogenesis protein [Parasulfuritortus cantonensis]
MPEALLYLLTVATYLGLSAYFRPGGPACCGPTGWGRLLLFVPLALHLYLLDEVILPGAGLSLGFGTSFSAVAALTVLFYGLAAWHYPLAGMQSFVLMFGAFGVLLQAVMPGGRVLPDAGMPLFKVHMLAAFAAYGLFAVAALHAALIAIAEKHLHRPVPTRMVAGLPPLLTLEKLLFRMVELGFLILTLTLLSGIFFSESIYGRAFPLTHMTVFGIASWAIYAALLSGRRIYGWRGRTAIFWTLAGFVTLLLSYVGVKFVLEVLLGRA